MSELFLQSVWPDGSGFARSLPAPKSGAKLVATSDWSEIWFRHGKTPQSLQLRAELTAVKTLDVGSGLRV
jgi:hypothetical protein